ncbi:MAG: ABC transporter substrate-binding protein [Proteobacteria bacterium]|nr:ABC transporter substrate-binding protein [Pseudomonadota bacterium]
MKGLRSLVVLGVALAWSHAAVAQKDTLALGMSVEPPHLDPTGGAAGSIREVTYANVYEGLTRIDRNGRVQPGLAESWTRADDGLAYTFRLRGGVKFHDGKDFSSADVKFTFDRAMASDSTNAQKWIFAPIAGVETPDARSVVIKLKYPVGNFLYNLGWGDAVIFAPESAANNKTNPVGTGPFKFERWVRGDRVELAKFDQYWNKDAIKLKRVSFRFIQDPSAQVSALRAGDLDAFPSLGAPETLDQFKADKRYRVVVGATEGETILAINNTKSPLNDVRVRRALAHAVDRKSVIDGAWSGYGTPIGSHFSPLHPAYVDLTGVYPYDPAKAKALLSEAGYPNGFALSMRLPPFPYAPRAGEIVAAQLAQVGIKANIELIQAPQWLTQVFRERQYDLTIVSHTEPLDINIYARDDYYFGYVNPAFKDLIARIDRTLDDGERNRLYGEAQRMIATDSVNVFLFQLPKLGVWNADLDGLWENSPIQANDVTQAYWKR